MTPVGGTQRAFPFAVHEARKAGDFLVAQANREAVAWVNGWPAWPSPGLVVHGPPGCGKSHLAAVWAARSGACVIAAAALAEEGPAALAENVRFAAVDDVAAGTDEAALFHLYNAVFSRQGGLLLTAASAPAELVFALPDLRSRINALPAVEISEPDDSLLAGVLMKLFADRQIAAPAGVVDYLAVRIERSFSAARDIVAAIDRTAWEQGRAVTVPLVRDIVRGHAACG